MSDIIPFPTAPAQIAPAGKRELKGSVIQFPTTPGRYAVATKSHGSSMHIRSRDHSLNRAFVNLMAVLLGERPAELEWAALYDTANGEPDPRTTALFFNAFKNGRRGRLYDNRPLIGMGPGANAS